jgi:CheY-like chemotaxis protein
VLLADPCPDTVESLGWLLRLWGFDVRAAGTGSAALASALADPPGAVLMEIRLPLLDGWQLARQLRDEKGPTRPLLLAVSGCGREQDLARSRAAGFDCHLVKPAPPEVIRAWLLANLVGREAARRAPASHAANRRSRAPGASAPDHMGRFIWEATTGGAGMRGLEERAADAASVERLASETGEKLRGRLSDLRLELHGSGIVIRGTARSFYAKQLAQQAVMKGTDLPIVRNEIEVV